MANAKWGPKQAKAQSSGCGCRKNIISGDREKSQLVGSRRK